MKIEIQIMILGMKIVAPRIEGIPNEYQRHSIYGVKCLARQSLESTSDIPYNLRSRSTRSQVNRDTSDLDMASIHVTEYREIASANNLENVTVDVSPPRMHPYNLRSRTLTS
jgi:hypothetical protein